MTKKDPNICKVHYRCTMPGENVQSQHSQNAEGDKTKLPEIYFHHGRHSQQGVQCLDFQKILIKGGHDHSPSHPHRIHFHVLMFWREQGDHEVDFVTYRCQPGDLLYIDPGSEHAFLSENTCADGVLLSEDLVRRLEEHLPPGALFALKMTRKMSFDQRTIELIQSCLKHIRTVAQLDRQQLTMDLLIAYLIMVCNPSLSKLGSARDVMRFKAFTELVENDCRRCHSASYYANKLGMSPGGLSKLVSSMSGLTAKAWIDQHLLIEAKRHLSTAPVTIEAVSFMLGFKEPTHFVRFFKRLSGITPYVFRQSKRSYG